MNAVQNRNPLVRGPAIRLNLLVVGMIGQLALGLRSRSGLAIIFCLAVLLWFSVVTDALRGRLSSAAVFTAVLIAVAAAVVLPPATSKDVNSYAIYGRMVATYDTSPYSHVPQDFPGDEWYPRVSKFWNDSPSVYGPVFTGASTVIMSVAETSYTKARVGFQGLAALCLLGAIALLWRLTKRVDVVAFVGLNPLVLGFGVNDAHCDLLVGLFVLVGAWLIGTRKVITGAAVLALAVLVKVSAAPALAGAVVWVWFKFGKWEAVKAALVGGALSIAGVLLAGGSAVLDALSEASQRQTRFSLWNPLHELITWVMHQAGSTSFDADGTVAFGASLVVALVGSYFILRHRRDVTPFVIVAVGLVAYQVLGAYVLSWYATWTLPVLALVWRSRTATVVMLHGSWLALAYLNGYFALIAAVFVVAWVVYRLKRRESLIPWPLDETTMTAVTR